MGVRNKQRRREKARRRAEHGRRQAAHSWVRDDEAATPSSGTKPNPQQIREALWDLVGLRRAENSSKSFGIVFDDAVFVDVVAEAELQLAWLIGQVWQRGWQPSELARYACRRDQQIGRIVRLLIAHDHARRDRETMHPQWSEQAVAVSSGIVAEPGWLRSVVESAEDVPPSRVLLIIRSLELLANIAYLPTILPPPGTDPSTWNRRDDGRVTDDPILAKVRALLAQAESTTFEAEAETFTAKAQELMARHAIDAAVLWSRSDRSDRPVTIRLSIDDPYADQKSHLLHVVAKHSRCKAVTHQGLGLVSVVGFPGDIAATEVLFTSLLVQSHAAMLAEAANALPGAHTRGRAFRSSFLFAYACRIDRRLSEVNEAVEAEATSHTASDLLPVLAARADAIDEEIAATFGPLTTSRARRTYDALGWDRGALAADRAQLRPDLPAAGA